MTYQSPRIYLYKITFEEVPYYYYGVHKERKFDEEYWGSPVTNKWCWELYTPKKQILELFDYSDDGWLEAKLIEDRLIKPFFNDDKWCLNENCGGIISLDILRKSANKLKELKLGIHARTKEEMILQGIKNYELGLGIHSLTLEQRIENGKKGGNISGKISGKAHKENGTGVFSRSEEKMTEDGRRGGLKSKELGIGIHALTTEQRSENGKKGGKISGKKSKENKTGVFGRSKEQMSEDGRRGGKRSKELGVGIHGRTKEEIIEHSSKVGKLTYELGVGIHGRTKEKMTEDAKKAAKVINSQKWMCLETGFVSTFGPLTQYQKKRNIDTSKRVRVS
jgi:general stress protein YciG